MEHLAESRLPGKELYQPPVLKPPKRHDPAITDRPTGRVSVVQSQRE
ncbi:hypothetical protein RRSWK_04887 [Rhodopirellula sp. SWK7]|nr:hypothetical protein RRSWK_04887 [Rhodopirellula sp. SWK7]